MITLDSQIGGEQSKSGGLTMASSTLSAEATQAEYLKFK